MKLIVLIMLIKNLETYLIQISYQIPKMVKLKDRKVHDIIQRNLKGTIIGNRTYIIINKKRYNSIKIYLKIRILIISIKNQI